MRIKVTLEGVTPLMMHNERLANSEDQFTRQIKEITAKGKNQTDKDRADVSKLEWYGGLYTDANGNLVIPAANIIKCFRDRATATKEGKKIAAAITPTALNFPLINGGPSNPDEIFKKPEYIDKRSVGIGRKRVTRTRPIFHRWSVVSEFELVDEVMNLSDFERIAEGAGVSTGLGDARIIGYGRFKAKVKKL
jgi:hypothetical protein